jgi:hypothetical protein
MQSFMSMMTMNLQAVFEILSEDDGALPDINFDFGSERKVAVAYAIIQEQSTHLVSKRAYYWSISQQNEVPIIFGQNPAEMVLTGEAENFHVVFGGIHSSSGNPIPDIGVSICGSTDMSLDYPMGKEWNLLAVEGLLEIMSNLKQLAPETIVSHTENIFDPDGKVLLSALDIYMLR